MGDDKRIKELNCRPDDKGQVVCKGKYSDEKGLNVKECTIKYANGYAQDVEGDIDCMKQLHNDAKQLLKKEDIDIEDEIV